MREREKEQTFILWMSKITAINNLQRFFSLFARHLLRRKIWITCIFCVCVFVCYLSKKFVLSIKTSILILWDLTINSHMEQNSTAAAAAANSMKVFWKFARTTTMHFGLCLWYTWNSYTHNKEKKFLKAKHFHRQASCDLEQGKNENVRGEEEDFHQNPRRNTSKTYSIEKVIFSTMNETNEH